MTTSEIQSTIHRSAMVAYEVGLKEGRKEAQEHIIKLLTGYFELTQEPDDTGKPTNNPEWDRGFQAALALVRTHQK